MCAPIYRLLSSPRAREAVDWMPHSASWPTLTCARKRSLFTCTCMAHTVYSTTRSHRSPPHAAQRAHNPGRHCIKRPMKHNDLVLAIDVVVDRIGLLSLGRCHPLPLRALACPSTPSPVDVSRQHTRTHTHTHTRARTRAHTHTHTHTHTRARTRAHTHTHTHTHTAAAAAVRHSHAHVGTKEAHHQALWSHPREDQEGSQVGLCVCHVQVGCRP
jgi:hypothetical protein